MKRKPQLDLVPRDARAEDAEYFARLEKLLKKMLRELYPLYIRYVEKICAEERKIQRGEAASPIYQRERKGRIRSERKGMLRVVKKSSV